MAPSILAGVSATGRSATVSELVCYPVKGCAGQSLDTARMTVRGIDHDREFMIVDDDFSFRSQRSDPVLAVVTPSIDGDELTLTHEEFGSVTCTIDRRSQPIDVTMFRAPFLGIDQGDDVASWLSDVVGEASRLVAVPSDFHRVTDGITPGTAAFADSSAVHILSESTLDGLNTRMDAPLPMNRFRPNIVVTGWDDPHTEDLVRDISIGETELAYTKLAIRCPVTTVDQARGVRDGREPLKTLGTYRKARQKGVAFGAKFSVVDGGTLSVGDTVNVTTWGESEL
ncbi:MOSC domain-containing protein [Rhodococcus sp. RS1C4]|nr:MOSC domain-containing protein [Rhodococcus sp. RS1C4]OZD15292.1 MOSC domain-containing protein [Rhodococcus sp. 06-156-4C]OZD19620.1 MOSC domain-containing protein [Rhodococcus sp. 06-156-4a]OZD23069.1 MOSC domain-containing protein [Rhodococcus sp. 06-156-3C]OZD25638.1 MOSC domain-containing protein [Rhodococcus sp. 06-156-3b]OZD37845.1 MOSC domain-containing protein [Rhodococcus sp. 06-156-3]OZF68665.1 MOSC domain-containing protein [Rhodococcus sp. 06-156-4]